MTSAKRRAFRYSLGALLAVIGVAAAGCAWVTWPTRVAANFVNEHYRKDIEVSNPFRDGTPESLAFEKNVKPRLLSQEQERIAKLRVVPHERSLFDILSGRQTFDFGMEEFTICRGKVVAGPTQFFESVHRYYR